MRSELIVGLVAAIALVDLFRLRAQQATLSRAGVLVASIARALLPVAAAVVVGVWQLIRSYERIAETGSAGVTAVTIPTEQLVRALLAGVISFAVVLVVGWLMAARARLIESGTATFAGRRRKLAALIGVTALLLTAGGTW